MITMSEKNHRASLKQAELKAWCRQQGVFSTVQVKKWGDNNSFTSADVRVRELVRKNFLERISDSEAILKGLVKKGNRPIAWYRVAGANV